MSQNTPLLGFPYMADGDAQNANQLQRTLRLLDVAANLVLESVTTTITPTDPQPGQAWFIPAGTTCTGDWGAVFGTTPLSDPIIAAYVRSNDLSDIVEYRNWVSISVPSVLYGFVKDADSRQQWDGSTWSQSSKLQAGTLNQFWRAGSPVLNPGTTAAFIAMKAPFDMEIVAVGMSFAGGAVVSGSSEKAMFAPEIRYAMDPTQPFSNWTLLLKAGSDGGESGGWDAASMSAASAAAYDRGLSAVPASHPSAATQAPFHTTTIPDGATIAMGNWLAGAFGTNAELSSCTLTSLTFTYKSA